MNDAMPRESAPGAMAPPWPPPHAYGNERLWLDCLIEREILRLRARYELSLDELRGLYVSDRQVDELLRRQAQELGNAAFEALGPAAALSGQAAQWRAHFAPDSPLELLGQRLALADADLELLFVSFAPELDLRYDTLYAYLNNDITRKHATLDLARRLLGGRDPDGVRARVHALATQGILDPPDPGERRSALGLGVHLAPAIAQFLLGLAPVPDRVPGAGLHAQVQLETVEGKGGARPRDSAQGELLACRGNDHDRLEQWAGAQLRARGRHGLHVQAAALAAEPAAILLARIAGAALVLHEPAGTLHDPASDQRLAAALAHALGAGLDVLCLVAPGWQPGPACAALAPAILDLPASSTNDQLRDWQLALDSAGFTGIDLAQSSTTLAARFSFGPARIRQALASARALVDTDPGCRDAGSALERSARELAAQPLARVAQLATRPHGWSQLVLPATTSVLLREVAAAIACRRQVYRDWQMQRRTGRSAGLMLLFTGASGTGKTMAASVLANHVGLDLFRVDLAGVISKYIGETEKNLDRIFRAANDADALLLFDEADALLGKRAEVKDAHDRYANIEVAYLLQKMEEHDGVVILASNLPKNLDQAFSRRMHYVVEVARPGPLLREQLWRGIFPAQVPLAADIDYGFLAGEFDLTGGDIQTIALEAAFLAAGEGSRLGMAQLMRALARRQTKHGDPGVAARFRTHQGAANQEPP